MNNEGKYYFAFRKKHELYGYWVEIFTYSEREAMDTFQTLYENWQRPISKDALKYHPKGCYRKIHLPLPEDIKIDSEDPFFSEPKPRKNFIWAHIGARMIGKSHHASSIAMDWQKNNPSKKVIIYDPGMD